MKSPWIPAFAGMTVRRFAAIGVPVRYGLGPGFREEDGGVEVTRGKCPCASGLDPGFRRDDREGGTPVRRSAASQPQPREAINASISSALRASAFVSTCGSSRVTSTSSSVRMPMPRHFASTVVSSGEI